MLGLLILMCMLQVIGYTDYPSLQDGVLPKELQTALN